MTMQKVSNSIPCNHNRPPFSTGGKRSITPEKIEGNRLPGRCWQHRGQHITPFDRLQEKKRGVSCGNAVIRLASGFFPKSFFNSPCLANRPQKRKTRRSHPQKSSAHDDKPRRPPFPTEMLLYRRPDTQNQNRAAWLCIDAALVRKAVFIIKGNIRCFLVRIPEKDGSHTITGFIRHQDAVYVF